MEWKMAALAIVIAIGLWISSNTAQPASLVIPQYEVTDQTGTHTIPLACVEMVDMRALTEQQGMLREADAYSCGTNRDGKCLPYYMQDAVMHELYDYLERAIADNCKES